MSGIYRHWAGKIQRVFTSSDTTGILPNSPILIGCRKGIYPSCVVFI